MANNQPDRPERPRGWLAKFVILGFVAGTCAGTIINDVAGTHGATLWGAPIGLGLGLLAGLVVRPRRKV
jgi:hypothetical protein